MRILKRLLDFIASRMLLITVVCALLVISFYLAMNTANIWVLIDDGLDARAQDARFNQQVGRNQNEKKTKNPSSKHVNHSPLHRHKRTMAMQN